MIEDPVGIPALGIIDDCFGYLAVRVARALPIRFPMTTGVGPMTGGLLAKPY
jgi:1,6-anhydro-N-acetylmuramate kinase